MKSAFANVLDAGCIVKEWNDGESRAYAITRYQPGSLLPWHCGYVMFPSCPLREDRCDNPQVRAVRVHGGITFAEKDPETGRYVYGFDCAHFGDDHDPEKSDIDWLTKECERLGSEIDRVAREEV